MARKIKELADLPENLSDLLELSVQDAVRCDMSPKYTLDMGSWVRPNGACKVCMAGAVMVQTGAWTGGEVRDPHENFESRSDTSDSQRYYAINCMREGLFSAAASRLDLEMSDEVQDKARKAVGMVRNEKFGFGFWLEPAAYDRRGDRYTWLQYLKAAAVLRANGF